MPYISRKKYKSRREKHANTARNVRITILALLLIFSILCYFNRVYIRDIIITSFY